MIYRNKSAQLTIETNIHFLKEFCVGNFLTLKLYTFLKYITSNKKKSCIVPYHKMYLNTF